jgi:hypothetical protein
VNKTRFSIDKLPVEALLRVTNSAIFSDMRDAQKISTTLSKWLLPRHINSFYLHLPLRYFEESFTFKSGLKVHELPKSGGFQVLVEYGPDLADQMFPLLPTGHPDNPLSYRILATCTSDSFVEKNDLKISEFKDETQNL